MSGLLNRLRNKSEKEKKKILYLYTVVIMVFVFVVWSALVYFFDDKNDKGFFKNLDYFLSDIGQSLDSALSDTRSGLNEYWGETK
ncbi:hypothetical protein A3I18_00920 [Candidatus Campbellbacteria bacterium RIFCSPLOWO2_02_FULL_35_11]|uniref:Uncharacterized protein n=1 Tax=Candidatus Campbellbacteria bacterium RIFCSPLOWO2_02_FULL_35_11 TaxID=1797581 RepID=A0A1F5ERZ4_9BACT|nr:MAG: hypothetical protein A3I18_00920 [Candidatus Campbellbacteria bacterium RIFCSPLOWO2_02_FULL_35_11]